MSRYDEPITRATLRLSAELTVRQHGPGGNIWRPGTCWQCRPDGCPQLCWALDVLASGLVADPISDAAGRAADAVLPRRRRVPAG